MARVPELRRAVLMPAWVSSIQSAVLIGYLAAAAVPAAHAGTLILLAGVVTTLVAVSALVMGPTHRAGISRRSR